MSYQHSNRVFQHLDNPLIASLSPVERSVLHFILQGINDKKPELMTFSNAYLADLTGYSESGCQKATKSLVAKGVLSATRKRARAATLYALLIECPEGCRKRSEHYTPLELKLIRERLSVDGSESVSEVTLDSPMTRSSSVTNKQLTNTNKQLGEFAESKPAAREFSYFEFLKILHSSDPTDGLQEAIYQNPERAYEVALKLIDQVAAKEPVSDPVALIRWYYQTKPKALLGGAPGTNPRNPDFKREALAVERGDYYEDIWHLCAYLEIDYEPIATTKLYHPETGEQMAGERFLRGHWVKGTLSPQIVAWAYNETCPPEERTLWAPMSPYERDKAY